MQGEGNGVQIRQGNEEEAIKRDEMETLHGTRTISLSSLDFREFYIEILVHFKYTRVL